MMKWVKQARRPSPTFVIALVALFFALGGTGYAVSQLPKNSVTSVQVRDHSLLRHDFKQGQLPRGEEGPQGLPGAQGAKGDKGDPGDPWTLGNGLLPSGKTIRGVFAPGGLADTQGELAQEAISFGFSIANGVNPVAHFIEAGAQPPPECPGTVHNPAAQPGHLCVYEGVFSNSSSSCPVFNPVNNTCPGSAVRGFGVQIVSDGPGEFWSQGSWAVTAP
jgi:hypothetical protein